MRHKTLELLEVKADGGEGQFTALASVFGNVDLGGDKMLPGSFAKTLEAWRASGDPIPVVLSHQWDDPFAYVGKADPSQVIETDAGLQVNGTLDTSTPMGKQVYSLMKQRLIKGWSFGYTVPDGGEAFKDGINEVSQVDLIEVGPTLKGMNPEAQLQAIKALKADTYDAMPVLNQMMELAQQFNSNEPDDADRQKMTGIMDNLQALIASENAEGKSVKGESPDEQPPEDKGTESEEPGGSTSKVSDPLKDQIESTWMDVYVGPTS